MLQLSQLVHQKYIHASVVAPLTCAAVGVGVGVGVGIISCPSKAIKRKSTSLFLTVR
jgi:hypothetical protein